MEQIDPRRWKFLCADCGFDTWDDEYYMLKNHVWNAAIDAKPNTDRHIMLCIGCVESRLGRQLTKEDFSNYSINTIFPRSVRLNARMSS